MDKRIGLFLLLLLIPLGASAWGSREKDAPTPPEQKAARITVEGLVRLVGNEPFTMFVLKTADNSEYFLPDAFRKAHRELVNRMIRVEGTPEVEVLQTADHKHKVVRHLLLDVKLLVILE